MDVTSHDWKDVTELEAGHQVRARYVLKAVRRTGADRTCNLTIEGVHASYVLVGDTPVFVHDDGETLSRDDLSLEQLRNLKRFEKKLPADAESTVITRGANGAVQFEAKVSGRVSGSHANYAKTIDASGGTIGYLKTKVVPDGSVAHVKGKMTGGCP
ncbi:hypothetical protein OHS58_05805 [Amycolatopsis sp. NBC_00348]|uniref:hypothetical protein n=1 Tax=Amycolatopsis sp. NBC_00348 TaxID=2975956 RepID=UPI002E271B87